MTILLIILIAVSFAFMLVTVICYFISDAILNQKQKDAAEKQMRKGCEP